MFFLKYVILIIWINLFSSDSVWQRRSSRFGNLTHSLADSEKNLLCLSESTSMTTKWHQVSPKWSQMIPKLSQIIPRWSQMTPKVFQMTQWSQLTPSWSCRPLVLFTYPRQGLKWLSLHNLEIISMFSCYFTPFHKLWWFNFFNLCDNICQGYLSIYILKLSYEVSASKLEMGSF